MAVTYFLLSFFVWKMSHPVRFTFLGCNFFCSTSVISSDAELLKDCLLIAFKNRRRISAA